jgi:hypothetical protein
MLPALSADQLHSIEVAAQALYREHRAAFRAAVAAELEGCRVVGDGVVGRAIRAAYSRFRHCHVEPERVESRWARD